MITKIAMPPVGQTSGEAKINFWLKDEGEWVEMGEPLMEVETDKASVEVESYASGYLRRILRSAEEVVAAGELIAYMSDEADEPLPEMEAVVQAEAVAAAASKETEQSSTITAEPAGEALASPRARKLAREQDVDIKQVTGSGPDGRIAERDVVAFLDKQASAPAAAAAQAAVASAPAAAPVAAQVEFEDLSRLRRVTGERLVQSVHEAPHFILSVDVDMSEAGRLRERLGTSPDWSDKPSYTAIVLRVVAECLKRHPRVNGSFAGGQIKLHNDVNLGVAMAVPDGLIVPVIPRADQKTLKATSETLAELQRKAKDMKFKPDEFAGGTFTVSNLGMFGVDRFQAIINPPEAAILAVGRIAKRAVVVDDELAVRPIMTLTLSVDHRVLDGADGARFLADIKRFLENPYELI